MIYYYPEYLYVGAINDTERVYGKKGRFKLSAVKSMRHWVEQADRFTHQDFMNKLNELKSEVDKHMSHKPENKQFYLGSIRCMSQMVRHATTSYRKALPAEKTFNIGKHTVTADQIWHAARQPNALLVDAVGNEFKSLEFQNMHDWLETRKSNSPTNQVNRFVNTKVEGSQEMPRFRARIDHDNGTHFYLYDIAIYHYEWLAIGIFRVFLEKQLPDDYFVNEFTIDGPEGFEIDIDENDEWINFSASGIEMLPPGKGQKWINLSHVKHVH